ncbi:MAG TPA: type IX secretion system membrane protein PorP/SprF, partial [Flavobacteriales bacterium]|nr:type IX secretion system membrane protein PorP/SprF [Flavobacteriales bacterium]
MAKNILKMAISHCSNRRYMKTRPIVQMHKIVLTLFCVMVFCNGYAQDLHFSQFNQVPQLINPSLTGAFQGDFRGIMNYRDQWSSIAPYKTYSLAIDGGLFKKKLTGKYLGAGLFIFQDIAGDSRLSTTQVNLSLSSIISINKSHNISAGIQGGFSQRKMDDAGLYWGAQYDDNGYAAGIAAGEADAFENYAFGDFSLGLSWSYGKGSTNITRNDHLSANAGIAMYHLNKPEQGPGLDKLKPEFVAHAELMVGLKGTQITIVPSALYLQQGQLHEINVGGMVRYTIKEESKYTGFIK